MSFVSYAQNFEDVMLWRALKHVEHGLYVDIGAQHPVVDSVSMAFHEAGWRGVHIEPVPAYAELLRQARPGDTVLQVALGAAEGTLELNVIDDSGLSTAVDQYADQHSRERGFTPHRVHVPMLTMTSALRSLAGREIHWLKIDVEGFEEQVLRGWDSKAIRPWIMVVEATIPNSPQTDYAGWDPILTAADYRFVYFDGLNRFYVAAEHAELTAAFAAPPNVFDGAQLSGLASSALCEGVLARARDAERLHAAREQWLRNEWDAARAAAEQASHTHALAAEQRAAEAEAAVLAAREELDRLHAAVAAERAAAESAVQAAREELERLHVAVAAERAAADAVEATIASHAAAHAALLEQRGATEQEWQAKVAELQHWSHHWYTVATGTEQQRQALLASLSWRVTAPLRRASAGARRLVRALRRLPARLRNEPAHLAKRAFLWAMRKVLHNRRLAHFALGLLAAHPRLKARLRRIAVPTTFDGGNLLASIETATAMNDLPQHLLTERAARLYAGLRSAAADKEH